MKQFKYTFCNKTSFLNAEKPQDVFNKVIDDTFDEDYALRAKEWSVCAKKGEQFTNPYYFLSIEVAEDKSNVIASLWDFIAEYLPNYYSSDEVAHNDDLHKIVHNEEEWADGNGQEFRPDYLKDYTKDSALKELEESTDKLFLQALENYKEQFTARME